MTKLIENKPIAFNIAKLTGESESHINLLGMTKFGPSWKKKKDILEKTRVILEALGYTVGEKINTENAEKNDIYDDALHNFIIDRTFVEKIAEKDKMYLVMNDRFSWVTINAVSHQYWIEKPTVRSRFRVFEAYEVRRADIL